MKAALRSRSKRKAKPAPAVSPTAVLWRGIGSILQRRWLRRTLIGGGSAVAVFCLLFAVLWWRLGSGPIEFDVATPWLTSAIEDNFGDNYKVQVGGTQIERDGNGRIRLRLRDIVVRDGEGAIAASAPKAEVGFSSRTLLAGRVRAERLALVGAEMSVRIEQSGNVTIFAGSDKRPIATTSVPGMNVDSPRSPDAPNGSAEQPSQKGTFENFTALLAWIDSLGATGLDGHDLAELGLKNGNLTVDDQRNGKRWSFENIDLSLMRTRSGNIVFKVQSGMEDEDVWSMTVNVGRVREARRVFTLEARRVMAKYLLLALRLGDDPIMARVPLSAQLRAEIDTDGTMHSFQGRIIAEGGPLTGSTDPSAPSIDHAEFTLEWDATRRLIAMPFQVLAGSNRFTLFAHIEPPRTPGGPWNVAIPAGTIVLGGDKSSPPLVFSPKIRARIDVNERRVTLLQGDIANADIGVAVTGDIDFSTADPKLSVGLAGTRMPFAAMKKMWPTFINAPVRNWVLEHILSGDVEKVAIATNAHLSAFKKGGPPVPDDGLLIEIFARNAVMRPLDTLPSIEDAEMSVKVAGRYAAVSVSKGSALLPSGRKLTLTNGVFEVPDTEIPEPPTRTELRVEGPVPVIAELLESDRLKEFSAMPFELSSAKGNVFAQASLAFPLKRDLPPGSSTYSVRADIANFSVDKMIMGQKVEAQSLRITADNQTYQIKGDAKIAGVPANLEYTKSKSDEDAKVRIRTTLDDSARTKFGIDPGNVMNGALPLKIEGTIGSQDRDSKFAIEADLAPAKIDNLLPGWSKPAGKAGRAKFNVITRGQAVRIEDLSVEGGGTQIRGGVELDNSGDVVSANFPVFSFSDGDKVSLKADRSQDGTLRVIMRGDVHDGRGFIKSAVSGSRQDPKGKPPIDFDLDLKLGAVIGFNGETLRNVDLKASRRGGQIRVFNLNAKLGRDSQITGDLRDIRRPQAAGNSLYFETRDAGALFRFTDSYANMVGGWLKVAMDPSMGAAPQEGVITIRDFAVRGEAALDRVVSGAQPGSRAGVKFDSAHAEFSRVPGGQLKIRDGVVQGNLGATIDGQIDYASDEIRLRGSFIPLSQLNNALGQLPIVGMLLGGGNEGLLGVTYEVVGPPNAPRLNVNPLSAVAPGVFRKIFEFRNAPSDRSFEPRRSD